MRNIIPALFITILFVSCSREKMDAPAKQAAPLLKRTVQTNAAGDLMRIAYYNNLELVALDTLFMTGTRNPGMIYVNTYNAKGKRTRQEHMIPILYTAGYYWAYDDIYQDDTLPAVSYRYLRGNQVARIAHLYNASKQLIQDSTWHTPNYGTFTYIVKYTYDASGRLASALDLNDTRDTTSYTTYQYAPNRIEKLVLTFPLYPPSRAYATTVTEYTSSGKILSEKKYGGDPAQLSSQVDYTYDATGHLLKKISTVVGGAVQEERYFNNAVTGKPEKMEFYGNNQLGYTTTYYYE